MKIKRCLAEGDCENRALIRDLTAALELFIQTVNPPYPQSMALWQEHLKAATENARKILDKKP